MDMIGDAEARELILSVLVFTAGVVIACASAFIALNVLAEMIVNPPQDRNTAMEQLLVLTISLLTTYVALRALFHNPELDVKGG
jgi:NO-binding membrane sensor protein with MHYT domain